MSAFDPRTLAVVQDLAAAELEGRRPAAAYVAHAPLVVAAERSPLFRAADRTAEQMDELVFGERFRPVVVDGAFAFGQALRDGYVGWVEAATLTAEDDPPSHRVAARFSLALAEPALRAPPRMRLCMNALVRVTEAEGRFVHVEGCGWAPARHLAPVGVFAEDPVDEALRFLGVPYHWGGRTALGVDCSGLVQQAFYACGRACPRDSDQQEGLGHPLPLPQSGAVLRRGDLVFWKGHVAMMTDERTMLHANAHHMAVVAEPLAEAIGRIEAAGGGPPTACRRP